VETRKTIGRYEVRECVGRGGMGALFRGHDPVLDREVAIKTMLADFSRDEDGRARFYREARAVARLQHRNIVTLFDFGEEAGAPYIVMEFLIGQTVADCVRSGMQLPIERILDIGAQLCTGLHFAHVRGIVHRDVKPPNIWLNDDGGVKVLDFGIAKFGDTTVTRIGGVVGSLSYMSPEQVNGSEDVDGRSDIFSVGIVLFELLSGKRPFRGDSPTAIMMKIVNEPTPALDVPGVPAPLVALIERALEKDPTRRFQQASEMASELRTLQHSVLGGTGSGRAMMPARALPEVAPISSPTHVEETRERSVAVATPPPAALVAPAAAAAHEEQDVIHRWSLGSADDLLADEMIGGQAAAPAVRHAAVDAGAAHAEAVSSPARSTEWLTRWPTLAVAAGALAIAGFAFVLLSRAEPSRAGHDQPAGAATAAGAGGATGSASSAAGNAGGKASGANPANGSAKGAVKNGTAAAGASGNAAANGSANPGGSASGNGTTAAGDPAGATTGSESTDVHVVLNGAYEFSVMDDSGHSLSGAYVRHDLRIAPKQVLRLQSRKYFLDQRVTVEGKPGSTMRLQAPALGKLTVRTARETCPVSLNGISLGFPPIAELPVASGKYRLAQTCPDGDPQTSIVTIAPGATEVALIH
jgi:hypothetical protein